MTLGGLLKHVALVEDSHFAIKLPGQEPGPPRDAVDWEADPGWEWGTGAQDDPAPSWPSGRRRGPVPRHCRPDAGRRRPRPARPLSDPGRWRIAQPARLPIDLIEEYARHTGHADLIWRVRRRPRLGGPAPLDGIRLASVARAPVAGYCLSPALLRAGRFLVGLARDPGPECGHRTDHVGAALPVARRPLRRCLGHLGRVNPSPGRDVLHVAHPSDQVSPVPVPGVACAVGIRQQLG